MSWYFKGKVYDAAENMRHKFRRIQKSTYFLKGLLCSDMGQNNSLKLPFTLLVDPKQIRDIVLQVNAELSEDRTSACNLQEHTSQVPARSTRSDQIRDCYIIH